MLKCYPLFGKKIDLGGVSYFVHGIVHDNPLISIPSKFKEIVNEKLRDCSVICEDGFSEWIRDSQSFEETKYFNLNKIKKSQYLNCLKNYIENRFVKKTHKTDLMKKVKEMNNLEDLKNIRKILFKKYPSEPNGMNALLLKTHNGTLENPKGELPLRIKRYFYETKESIKYAKSNNLNELHIVVGCAHELPLEYLLRNPKLIGV